jgi:hypothetical protein
VVKHKPPSSFAARLKALYRTPEDRAEMSRRVP